MKKYHVQNYVRYKHDMAAALNRLPDWPYQELSRDQLITKLANSLNVTSRTIHRHMCDELKKEKEILNEQV